MDFSVLWGVFKLQDSGEDEENQSKAKETELKKSKNKKNKRKKVSLFGIIGFLFF